MASSNSNGPNLEASKCNSCGKTGDPLKTCGRCRSVKYCNHSCQKADWKSHKKNCASIANTTASTAQSAPQDSLDTKPTPYTALSNNTWLHNRTEHDTFKILIDLIRLRQEDSLRFEEEIMDGTIYAGQPNSAPALRFLIERAGQIPGLLPIWWTSEKAEECVQFGIQGPDHLLFEPQQKSDIQRRWNDQEMPAKLRLCGHVIYGHTPGMIAGSGQSMLPIQAQVESGEGPFGSFHARFIDMAAMSGPM